MLQHFTALSKLSRLLPSGIVQELEKKAGRGGMFDRKKVERRLTRNGPALKEWWDRINEEGPKAADQVSS